MESILVIDDEIGIRHAISEILRREGLRVFTAENSEVGLKVAREESPLVILLDMRLGLESGLDVFSQLRSMNSRSLVIFITGHGTADTAIETMKLGAFDYLIKPLDIQQLQTTVEQALKISRLMRAPAAVETGTADGETSDRLIGSGRAMQSVCKQIGRIAPQDVNVLVLGESGTGKELVARAIYQHSLRAQSPFLAINCAAIPEQLLESELFGHEKGAFTSAERRRVGKFEQCHGGTILLDEVGDMPLATQAKILRLLQDGQFQRVGGNEPLAANVRILAATNQNLEAMIERGTFRRDLYYRLRGVVLNLPPLRERKEDLAELAHYFLFRFNRQLGTTVQSISAEALDLMLAHSWPGNIRELQSVVREALIVSAGSVLLPEFVAIESSATLAEMEPTALLGMVDPSDWQALGHYIKQALFEERADLYREAMLYFDRLIITLAMKQAGGLQSKASQLLSLSRPTLRSKLRAVLSMTDTEAASPEQ